MHYNEEELSNNDEVMTWEELEKVEAFLKENGYRNGGKPYHCNADHYWYKAFGKEDNPYQENRALWQVFFNVYDWRRFQYHEPTMTSIAVYKEIPRLQRWFIKKCFGLEYRIFE